MEEFIGYNLLNYTTLLPRRLQSLLIHTALYLLDRYCTETTSHIVLVYQHNQRKYCNHLPSIQNNHQGLIILHLDIHKWILVVTSTCRIMICIFNSFQVLRPLEPFDDCSLKQLTKLITLTVTVRIPRDLSITCERQGLWALWEKWSWPRPWSKTWVKCYATPLPSQTEIKINYEIHKTDSRTSCKYPVCYNSAYLWIRAKLCVAVYIFQLQWYKWSLYYGMWLFHLVHLKLCVERHFLFWE